MDIDNTLDMVTTNKNLEKFTPKFIIRLYSLPIITEKTYQYVLALFCNQNIF
jgi:hypothetical protein